MTSIKYWLPAKLDLKGWKNHAYNSTISEGISFLAREIGSAIGMLHTECKWDDSPNCKARHVVLEYRIDPDRSVAIQMVVTRFPQGPKFSLWAPYNGFHIKHRTIEEIAAEWPAIVDNLRRLNLFADIHYAPDGWPCTTSFYSSINLVAHADYS